MLGRQPVTLAAAAAGVITGATGLSLLAMPAGAGQPPSLPDVSAESLVEQVMTSKPGAFGGTVEVDNKLGLPSIAEIPQLADGKIKILAVSTPKRSPYLPGSPSSF